MNCQEARCQVMLYVDRESDPVVRRHIEHHLATCPGCAEYFAQEQRLEQALAERLAAGEATPALWGRVLERARVTDRAVTRRRWLAAGLAVAAAVVAAVVVLRTSGPAPSSELARAAADWHERLAQGDVRPGMVSTSDEEVDRYLKANVPFPVHCPPRTDVHFAVQGAGVCLLKDRHQAAYIVGRVGQARVSILVMDRASLDAFPYASDRLRSGGRDRGREGDLQTVAGLVRGNVVVVVGAAPLESLEKLLNAYGTYPEG